MATKKLAEAACETISWRDCSSRKWLKAGMITAVPCCASLAIQSSACVISGGSWRPVCVVVESLVAGLKVPDVEAVAGSQLPPFDVGGKYGMTGTDSAAPLSFLGQSTVEHITKVGYRDDGRVPVSVCPRCICCLDAQSITQ